MNRAGRRNDASTIILPRAATLDGFSTDASAAEGLHLDQLEPLTTVVVRTCNSVYRIIVSERSSVRVQGGRFFPDMTAAHLNGASAGGSLLKVAWIGIGLCMEISAGGQRIVTSPVCAIDTAPTPSGASAAARRH
jgi:hypothetical protein